MQESESSETMRRDSGWRTANQAPSLAEVHRTVTVPPSATPEIRERVDNLADLGASYPLPSLRLRVGWML